MFIKLIEILIINYSPRFYYRYLDDPLFDENSSVGLGYPSEHLKSELFS